MIVAGEQITLPQECPLTYDLDWRHRIATAVCKEAGHRIPRSLPRDEHLLEYTTHLRQEPEKRDPSSMYAQASSWHANEIRHAVESLLITAGTQDEIALLLNVSQEAVLAYGKVFFDVRDEAGVVLTNAVLNVRFNVPVPDSTNTIILRTAALTGGFKLVKSMLTNANTAAIDLSDSQSLRALVNGEFARRLLAGRTTPADLSRIITAQAQLEKLRVDSGQSDKELRETKELLRGILALTAPKMLDPDAATERDNIAKFHNRVVAFKNVNETAVADSGVEAAVKQWSSMANANIQFTTPTPA